MKFSSPYRSFYDASPEENGENRELKELIAQKTFKKTKHIPMNIFTKTAFAAFAFLVAGSLFAPQAFAETVKFVDSTITVATDKIQVLVTRAFDKDRDSFSDEDITNLTENPSVTSVEYTRDEQGDRLDMTLLCAEGEDCELPTLGSGDEFWISSEEGDGELVRFQSGQKVEEMPNETNTVITVTPEGTNVESE